MKLTDKRFWKFEAMMLLCGFLLFGELLLGSLCNGGVFNMFVVVVLVVLLLYFAICGIPTWLLYKGNSWLKLAGYLYLISFLVLAVLLFIFSYDWNPITANMRPADISPDEGKYITDNELVTIVCALWAVFLAVPVLITSSLTKCWIVTRVKATADEFSLESIGVNGFAYSKSKALKIAETYYYSNKPILGGDVYQLKNGQIRATNDNWYCDRKSSETLAAYVVRSYKIAIEYIHQFPDNSNSLFGFVVDTQD